MDFYIPAKTSSKYLARICIIQSVYQPAGTYLKEAECRRSGNKMVSAALHIVLRTPNSDKAPLHFLHVWSGGILPMTVIHRHRTVVEWLLEALDGNSLYPV